MIFKIDKINKTASLFEVKAKIEELVIPLTVKYESTDYLITSICEINNGYIKTIKFVENSAVKTIYNLVGLNDNSNIEEIYLPESLKELKEGWCSSTDKLTKIVISPSNDHFIFKEDKYLFGKSDETKDEFDVLLFARRDIEEISIPSNIKIISSNAFSNCKNLKKVEIPPNSNLKKIKADAFSDSAIEEIFIPSKVTKICENSFSKCQNLRKVEIPKNSDLQIIEAFAFIRANIEEILIPSKVTKICKLAFFNCKNLRKVEIPTNSDLQIIEINAFVNTSIEEILIPSKVTKICEFAFLNCQNLRKVEIPTNSDLQIIETSAFSNTSIEEIFIPSKVTQICENAFSDCQNLRKVEIPTNSDLQIIKKHAFSNTIIEEIFIPSKVTKICEHAFDCDNLTKIEISENSDLREIEKNVFSEKKIKYIFISSKIQYYFRSIFYGFYNLIQIEIPKNSQETNTFIKKELTILPHIDIPFDCSIILSISINLHKIVIITKDYKAFVCNKSRNEGFQEYKIKDNSGNTYYPISGYCSVYYSLYMVSHFAKGMKTILVKNGNFLYFKNFNPVAIFCGYLNCAAIDLKGAILYIPHSYNEHSSRSVQPYYLPNEEKAVEIACLIDSVYVLNSKGTLYMSKNANSINIAFKQVDQFKRIKINQISGYYEHILVLTQDGKVYSKGKNHYSELGTGDIKDRLNKFFEITSLNKYKIVAVSAGKYHSLFLTSDGKILACGSNDYKQCFYEPKSNDYSTFLPVERPFQKGIEFCISSHGSSAFCVGFDPEMSPNRRVKDDIVIVLLGYNIKTQILQAFINNKFDSSFNNNNQIIEDYIIDLEIHKKVLKMRLIDPVDTALYIKKDVFSTNNIIYFYDNTSNYSSFDELDKINKIANEIWFDYTSIVFVNYIGTNSSSKKLNYDEIARKYKCKIFEVGADKNIKDIDKPFFSFIPNINEYKNDILKIGKEYRNPFNDINKNHINIGLFGSKNVNKTELAFRYTYGDNYKDFYNNFINKFADIKMEKIVEIKSNCFHVSVLDSSFVNDNDDDFRSYYSAVQGIVFVFQIDLLSSSSDFINEINQFHQNAKKSVKGELNFTIALKVEESDQIDDLYQSLFNKINQIEERFDCKVFLFSIENGENVEDLFYFLIRKIIRNRKHEKVSQPKKKHNKKKKTKTSKYNE